MFITNSISRSTKCIIVVIFLLTSCATTKPNWRDSVKNPNNSSYKSQMDYMQKNYNQLGDSSIIWYYNKISKNHHINLD